MARPSPVERPPTITDILAVYCEGWCPEARGVVAPITVDEARARDSRGGQYAVVLFAHGTPKLLIEVCWRWHAMVVWRFDDSLRRDVRRDYRGPEAGMDLVLVEEKAWWYRDETMPEFDRAATHAFRVTRFPPGSPVDGIDQVLEDTGRSTTLGRVQPAYLRLPRPEFGDWVAVGLAGFKELPGRRRTLGRREDEERLLAQIFGGVEPPLLTGASARTRFTDGMPAGITIVPDAGRDGVPVWQPPKPLRPDLRMITPASPPRTVLTFDGPVLVETRPAGRLRLPTGRIVACDPTELDDNPFTIAVPPGEYLVDINVGHPQHGSSRVAAARLLIRDEPVATWEMALRAGENPRLLPDREAFVFGVDAGVACFVDAGSVAALTRQARDMTYLEERGLVGELVDATTGANLVMYDSGWGDGAYPVWIGRSTTGEVTCFVADMLFLPHG